MEYRAQRRIAAVGIAGQPGPHRDDGEHGWPLARRPLRRHSDAMTAAATFHATAFDFGGHRFVALADRALYWPRHGALIVADLHLEKASWYAALGQPLPPYDSHDTLDRLAGLAAQTGATAIWCLGDSFHDREAADRIAPAVAARLFGQAASAKLLWIAGTTFRIL